MAGPLSHIRVLDLSRIMAGPWAGQVLADLGADVVKVERPGLGDDTRAWGPPFLKDKSGAETREAGYYLCVNRGKRSITIELDKPEGQRVVRALAARSGFGQTGPRRDAAAYDFMIQAMCGLMSVTGEPDDKPGGCPEKVGVPIVDIMSGMYAAISVLAALARRNETGRGDYIDIAMLDVGTACLANQAMNYLVSGKVPQRTGNAHPNIQPQDVFATRDGHMVLVVGNDGQFGKACEVLGHPQWAKDDRFAKNAGRVRNRVQLMTLIAEVLRERNTAEWVARLEAAGVPCGPINSVPQVFADAQVRHRGMLVDIPHPLSGTVAQVVSPMRFAEAALAFERAPPLLGEHTADILRELGIEEAQGAA